MSQYPNYILRQIWNVLKSSPSSISTSTSASPNTREVILPPYLSSALEKIQQPTSLTTPFVNEKNRSTLDNWSTVLSYSQETNGSTNRLCGVSVLLRSEKNAGLFNYFFLYFFTAFFFLN